MVDVDVGGERPWFSKNRSEFHDNTSILEDLEEPSSARCDQWRGLPDVFPGERTATHDPATVVVNNVTMQSTTDTEMPLWCDRIQDMSGYAFPMDTTLQLSDELFNFSSTTAHNENDFDVQNENLSPAPEYILGDQMEPVLSEESNLFDNNYCSLDTKLKAWLPSSEEMEEISYQTSMVEDNGFFNPCINSENSYNPLEAQVSVKTSTTIKKPESLSVIFNSEEPRITKDLEKSTSSTDYKPNFDVKYEMEVAGEVEVMTEETETFGPNLNPFLDSQQNPFEFKEEDDIKPNVLGIEDEMSVNLNGAIGEDDEDLMDPLQAVSFFTQLEPQQLTLDINIAVGAPQNLGLPDTPDVLKALDGAMDFNIVEYIDDVNNNAFNLPMNNDDILQIQDNNHQPLHKYQRVRTGKPSRMKPSTVTRELSTISLPPLTSIEEPLNRINYALDTTAGPSSEFTATGRPLRKSATKFKKLLEEGFLDPSDPQATSSDDEDSSPKRKRRRTTSSTSNRRSRVNSDSDRSSICEDAQKYRERRDRNNISSKKSRQKRKALNNLTKQQMKELEEKNKKLHRLNDMLEEAVKKAHEFILNACKS